jgi:hypothetical protein
MSTEQLFDEVRLVDAPMRGDVGEDGVQRAGFQRE